MIMKQKDWPTDAWQCPFCDYHASSLEGLINHFRQKNQNGGGNHSYRYIRARFRIEPVKRMKIKPLLYSGEIELVGYDASKDPNNYRMKPTAFETNRRKH